MGKGDTLRLPNTRDTLLARIHTTLAADSHVVAAWLGGSVGRGEADAFSDLDVTVVVDDARAATLCGVDQARMTRAGAPAARWAFVTRFGRPAVVHENHFNVPPGSAFTIAIDAESAQQVDQFFYPDESYQRPVLDAAIRRYAKIGRAHV